MKPTILLMDLPRHRSPLLNQFYNYISREDGPFRIVRPTDGKEVVRPALVENWNLPIEEVIDKLLGELPDYIYWGFTPGSGLRESKDYLLRNRGKVKIIIDPGDYEVFSGIPGANTNFESVWADYVIIRCPKIKGYRTMKIVEDFIPTQEWLKGAKIINVPWGIDPDLYLEKNLERDIDVSLVSTMSNHFKCHEDRLKYFDILNGMKELDGIKVFAKKYLGKRVLPDDLFGDRYLGILHRSKMFIVTGSNRDFLVQKYLEGPACGTLLVGEIPSPGRHIFEDGVSFIEVNNDLEEKIKEVLKGPDRIKEMAQEGRRRILENFTVNKVSREFEETIMEDYK